MFGKRTAKIVPTGVSGPASDWGVAEKPVPMGMRPTAPMRTPAKTKTKRRRHAQLAAAELVLRNSFGAGAYFCRM